MRGGTDKLSVLRVNAWVKDPARTPSKLFDGRGLYLAMTPAGTPVWRLRYRIGDLDKTLAIGVYPEVSLAGARAERDAARELIRRGVDPVSDRRLRRAESTAAKGTSFAEVAEAWLAKNKSGWSETHHTIVGDALERDVLEHLGALPVAAITPAMVAKVIERIVGRGVIDTAKKVHFNVRSIFRYAQALGHCRDNPAEAAAEMIPRRQFKTRRPALLTWAELGAVLRAARAASLSPAVHMAHRLAAFSAQRLGPVVSAQWSEFHLNENPARWVVPREKMKVRDRPWPHVVILGDAFAEELRGWRSLGTRKGPLFPGEGQKPFITHESIEKAYRVTLKLKGKHVPHGWRAAFSTLAKDSGFDEASVELALDHVHDEDTVRAYDRGERLETRAKLAQWWTAQLVTAERQG